MEQLLITAASLADEEIVARGREVIRIEANAIAQLERALGAEFAAACRTIAAARESLARARR